MLAGEPRLLSAEEKRQALELVLASHTLARSDQLKVFLHYVCTEEIEGRGSKLSEYLVGVTVLGRPTGYSTGDDSTVRSRAHALRRKLEDFYAYEMPRAPVRIELPKGSYCPRFVALDPAPGTGSLGVGQPVPTPAAESIAPVPAPEVPQSRRPWNWVRLIVSGAALCLFLFLAGVYVARPADAVDPVVREAWGPLLARDALVMVCVATPPHLVVRQFDPGPRPGRWRAMPEDSELTAWYGERHRLGAGNSLYFLPTHHAPLWGDAAAALSVVSTLSLARVSYEVVPERASEPFALRNRNVILLGRPEYSRAATLLLERGYYRMDFDRRVMDEAVWHAEPGSTERKVIPVEKGFVYGLVTVLKGEGVAGAETRTVVISGVNSAGAQAAAEFFASAHGLREVRDRLRKEGRASWPQAWQVIIKAREDKYLPMNVSYVSHRVLDR